MVAAATRLAPSAMAPPRRAPASSRVGAPHDFGRYCEDLAAAFLTGTGWQVLERGYRFGRREIDVIARAGRTVIFVEVKGRRGPAYGHPLEAITAKKRREIEAVARQWVARYGKPGEVYRFDAVAVVLDEAGAPAVEHIADAWRM